MHRTLAASAAILLAVLAAGCAEGPERLVVPAPHPVADSPTRAIETLQWAYEHRQVELYRALFTEDFEFVFATEDSAGNAYRSVPWRREDESISARNLFVGGSATEEPATRITLTIHGPLVDLSDPRPGHDPTVHRVVDADVSLTIVRPSGAFEVRGASRFLVVRGDSAQVPTGLPAGATRWYIERWDDLTLQGGAAAAAAVPPRYGALPASVTTWGRIKILYR
jgi:hypothetical protein